jgi:ABC-type multidrug transport system ATPase subunit
MTLLSLESVNVSFTRGGLRVPVLREVSMDVATGEPFAIYGKRAAGKTTLLEVAAGILSPDSGATSFEGRDLGKLSRRELARLHRDKIGWVELRGPQASDVPMHVYLGMALYRSHSQREAAERALALLDRLGAIEYANARWGDLPDTVRILVAIGQALIREPKLLIVDDPVRGLGVTERESVTALLRETTYDAGAAVLFAVPEMPAMLQADRVRILANGKLIGPPAEEHGIVVEFPQTSSRN